VTDTERGGIVSIGDFATITDNTVKRNKYGLLLGGDSATIIGNTANENDYGIMISDNVNDVSITGNHIVRNKEVGIGLLPTDIVESPRISAQHTEEVEITNNYIYNNEIKNKQNVGGEYPYFGDPSSFIWTNPSGPTAGTNVMGGPTIAGNYWSNPDDTGWSDNEPGTATGYSDTPFEVVTGSGVYDDNPLVTYVPLPTPPNPHPDHPDHPDHPEHPITPNRPLNIVINTITIPPGSSPGSATTLTLILTQEGRLPLPDHATFILVPRNAINPLSEITATVTNGAFDTISFPFEIPFNPGDYVYHFQTFLLQTNPLTGEEIRIPAGAPIIFTVIVGEDGSVNVVVD